MKKAAERKRRKEEGRNAAERRGNAGAKNRRTGTEKQERKTAKEKADRFDRFCDMVLKCREKVFDVMK